MLSPTIGIGIAGTGFMARVQAIAFSRVTQIWDLPLRPKIVAFCGRPETPAGDLPRRPEFACAQPVRGWEALVRRSDVDLVCVCTSDASHADISLAALDAGKHVLCEKPLAHRLADSQLMARTAECSEAHAVVGFNYRRVPAIEHARRLIKDGDIGVPRHVRAAYMQDWGLDLHGIRQGGWRVDPRESPNGVLGDVGSHAIDTAQHLLGRRITSVACLHPGDQLPQAQDGHDTATAAVLAQFAGGAGGIIEASRTAPGCRNMFVVEIYGTEGALSFNLERLNELYVSGSLAMGETFRRLLMTENSHPWLSGRWPAGHPLGWEDTFVHQAQDLLFAIAGSQPFCPSFVDGCQVDAVIAAAMTAGRNADWTQVSTDGFTP